MSSPKQTPARNVNESKKDVDRRKFVQTIMASVPAISLTCALPALGAASGGGKEPEAKREDWICAIDRMFNIGDDLAVYLMLNCATNQFFTFIGTADMPLGDCGDPTAGGCHQIGAWNSYRRTDDEFQWVLSPELSDKDVARLDYVRMALKAGVQS